MVPEPIPRSASPRVEDTAMHAPSAVAKHPPARATYQDVLDAPPHMVAEILEGKLYMNPRPTMQHGKATAKLFFRLTAPYEERQNGPGGWQFTYEPEIHLDDHVLVPDLAGWLVEHLPESMRGPYTTVAPDWICETLSPSTRKIDLTVKRDIYANYRIQHLWYLDPDKLTLEALALDDSSYRSLGRVKGKKIVSLPPFESAQFPLTDLWLWN